MEKYEIIDIVKWLLSKEDMTHKRLQKYLYFLYAEYLVETNADVNNIGLKLFKNDFEAWVHGPVSKSIYSIFRGTGMSILTINSAIDNKIELQDVEILEKIYNKYMNFGTETLETMTHVHDPWKNARGVLGANEICTEPISDKSIFEFYSVN